MEDTPTGHIQTGDNPADSLIKEVLTNELVLQKILEHFPNTELLQLSFVNKLWNYEARSVIKKRGNLTAHLKAHNNDDRYKRFKDFQLDIQQMNMVPFSGISIHANYKGQPGATCPTAGLDSIVEGALERLPLKHLTVILGGNWWDHEGCPALLLIKRVFQLFSPVLESLSLRIGAGKGLFIQNVVPRGGFPRLKIFKPILRTDAVKIRRWRMRRVEEQ